MLRTARLLTARLLTAVLGLPLLHGTAAWAQRPEEAPPAAAGRGPIQGGLRVPIPRAATAERERAAGIAGPREREEEQLRDLNALSRQLDPAAPLPAPNLAPHAGTPGAGTPHVGTPHAAPRR